VKTRVFYVNAPFGLRCLSHNGNLTNAAELKADFQHRRHINTDSEVLGPMLAHELKTTR
jgi:glutamine phosphoribosylpyrophosphate amidotransferase